MSNAIIVSQTGNALHVKFNFDKIFIFENKHEIAVFKNNTGATAAFSAGLIVARDSSDNTIVPFDNAAPSDGDNIPIGILSQDVASSDDDDTTADVNYCHRGNVAEELLIFEGAETMTTVVTGTNQTVRDNLLKVGIKAVTSTSLSKADNE